MYSFVGIPISINWYKYAKYDVIIAFYILLIIKAMDSCLKTFLLLFFFYIIISVTLNEDMLSMLLNHNMKCG